MLHPCCGYDLQKGAKIIAAFDIIFSIFELGAAMVFESGPVTVLSSDVQDPTKRDVNFVVSTTFVYALTLVMIRIVQLCCCILLLYGVCEKNYKKCEIWLIFSLVIVVLAVMQIVFQLFIRDQWFVDGEPLSLRITIPGLELLCNWYFIWVVFAFMRDIKSKMGGGSSGSNTRQSTRDNSMLALEEKREMVLV